MGSVRVYHDPPLDGPTNMARDEQLLYGAERARAATFGGRGAESSACETQAATSEPQATDEAPAAILRLYGWAPPTISLGYFQKHALLAHLPPELRELAVVRRTTGGGAILHDQELTYCLILPAGHAAATRGPVELYRAVHGCFREALRDAGVETQIASDDLPLPTPRTGPFFCFEKPGRTDLLLGGVKVLGSAQRRANGAVMQHGSLLTGARFRYIRGGRSKD